MRRYAWPWRKCHRGFSKLTSAVISSRNGSPRPGQGKSGGFRTIVATNLKSRWFFVYGFAKSERDNIDDDEEAALKKLAASLLTMPQQALAKAL